MYKKQLTWQKILCFAALAACGILFLYSLGLSGNAVSVDGYISVDAPQIIVDTLQLEFQSLPLALFIEVLPKAHLNLHSRMSGSR